MWVFSYIGLGSISMADAVAMTALVSALVNIGALIHMSKQSGIWNGTVV
jgi:hypothetical protein